MFVCGQDGPNSVQVSFFSFFLTNIEQQIRGSFSIFNRFTEAYQSRAVIGTGSRKGLKFQSQRSGAFLGAHSAQ